MNSKFELACNEFQHAKIQGTDQNAGNNSVEFYATIEKVHNFYRMANRSPTHDGFSKKQKKMLG